MISLIGGVTFNLSLKIYKEVRRDEIAIVREKLKQKNKGGKSEERIIDSVLQHQRAELGAHGMGDAAR